MSSKTTQSNKNKHLAWWLHILFAVLFYIATKYILPTYLEATPNLSSLSGLLPQFAPIGTIIFLLLAANSLYSISSDSENEENDENDYNIKM